MVIYIDESGSINNHNAGSRYFVISLVNATNKESLKRAYKRFVSSNHDNLLKLDRNRSHPKTGKIVKEGSRMFCDGSFRELKGAYFDKDMKENFVDFFSRKQSFELYYIRVANKKLTEQQCRNTSHAFNYIIKYAIEFLISNGYLPDEYCSLQLDNRNEKAESRMFLQDYLNTELVMNKTASDMFDVTYHDSAKNSLVQIADVFSNLYYSHLQTGGYDREMRKLEDAGILKYIINFPG